jgi:hypothetical protein
MSRTVTRLPALALLLLGAGLARSGDAPKPEAILDKAIKAHGGEDILKKFPAAMLKGGGKVHAGGMVIDYTGEWALEGENKIRFTIAFKAGGQDFQFTQVLNGDMGWKKLGNEAAKAMTKDEVETGRVAAYVGNLGALYILKDKAYKLSLVGDSKVDGEDAIGITVAHQGKPDANLFFSKKTSLLLKSEARLKNDQGQEVNQEIYYSKYKEIEGSKQPSKLVIHHDGKPFVDAEFSEVTLSKSLDAALFGKP